MVEPAHEKASLARRLEADLFREHGPMLSGSHLCAALGYPSRDAFRQAVARGTVPVPIFPIANRRGKYALVMDVAIWLAERRAAAPKSAYRRRQSSIAGEHQ
jgi:hypothetical protein